ncbi:MAG: sigma-70 family RNA polymerase sigma factor [Myxococcaceae bacterium]|jgi:RNA polymerase sigma-70 factor (ECF subfamily)|nr:sigma-70 family RNA polymerase sigma factor [Myxococcaceae bacterium]MCA3011784.1 sigma-70 family RNA polymerase sigma factor [Myxococcaceae bacterium]
MSADERCLGDRLARGDGEALGALYAMYGSLVFAVALKLTKDRAEAEELVQETFLEAWQRAAQYQPERANVAAWLVTITRSRAIDRLRARGTVSRTLEVESRDVTEPPTRPDELVDSKRLRGEVRTRVARLPSEQRALLELAWDEGLSQREIAERTGLPLGTVKTRTRTALLALHADLKSLGAGG